MKDKMEKTVNIERMLHLKNSKKENINNKNKAGISLIILVVTIIVIIILVGTVILSLTNNNPINEANEATFKS
ncbi:MAG: hypothetical protein RR144_06205, partial [Clostridia bacterium]